MINLVMKYCREKNLFINLYPCHVCGWVKSTIKNAKIGKERKGKIVCFWLSYEFVIVTLG